MEDEFWWKTTLMEDNLWRKTTFGGRQPLMENNLWRKTTFDNLSPLKIQSLVCENECARIFLLPLLYPELFWKNYIFFQNLDRNTSGFHLLLTWGVQIWTETLIIWTSSLLDWSEWLLSSTPTIRMPQRRDNAGAVCNSGMGMLFLCIYGFYIISLRGVMNFFFHA